MAPLDGITVIDFSTLLPGPLATLILAEAGATVLKVERPGTGEDMRAYPPAFGKDSVNFALLNRGKRSIALDLKAPGAVDRLLPLIDRADVLVEQFRPGVMDRLGLGWERLSQRNPKLVYCAITGYGQTGPKAQIAGHDLKCDMAPRRRDRIAPRQDADAPAVAGQGAHDLAPQKSCGARNCGKATGQAGSCCRKAPARNKARAFERESFPEDVCGKAWAPTSSTRASTPCRARRTAATSSVRVWRASGSLLRAWTSTTSCSPAS